MNETTSWFEAGHVAIVTGGSKGFGRAVARELLRKGLHVIIDARHRDELTAAADELRAYGDAIAIPGDVSDANHAQELVETARARFGRLDVLVNNASTLGETPLPLLRRLSIPAFVDTFMVNLFAPVHLITHALPLLERGEGPATIVNVTSDAAVNAYATWGAYGASKAALEHASRILSEELAGTNVRVLVVDPGDMDTEMHRAALPDADPSSLRDPADVAHALLDAISSMREPFERISLEVPLNV
jgi:NAD(P)-dependent dehydrogenase (short-subunit alcohol dehydrogenase family)